MRFLYIILNLPISIVTDHAKNFKIQSRSLSLPGFAFFSVEDSERTMTGVTGHAPKKSENRKHESMSSNFECFYK